VVMLSDGKVAALTLGLDLTLRDLQGELKKKGAPWELSKAFDHSAPLGDWVPYDGQDLQALEFACDVNGQRRQSGNTKDMLFPVARLIQILSRTWALAPGDIVYTGTPAGVGPLAPGDVVTLSSPALGRYEWPCR
jgi:2-keto-4-pentenoate hydratase/2-oxohepta-3-ene-1,7-dioic acid hydratase in catechol pathway